MCIRKKQIQAPFGFSAVALAIFGAASLASSAAWAGEVPNAIAFANGPGWITVSYSHAHPSDVAAYSIARVGGGTVYLDASDGQWTDAGLSPNTTYQYRVCAIYKSGERACTEPPLSATTMKAPSSPTNYDPPSITNVEVSTNELKVTWGVVGQYANLHVQLSDPEGHVDQRQIRALANGSYTFGGLRSGVRYRIILQGCSANVFSPDGCGPWSPDRFATTALPPGEAPPPPPSNVTLSVRGPNAGAATLEFTVNVGTVSGGEKFLIFRDRKQIAEVKQLKGIIGGFGGSYADRLETSVHPHDYRVCFVQQPFKQVCSVTVAGPEPSVGIQRMPNDVRSKPVQIEPDQTGRVTKRPAGIKASPRRGTVLGR